MEIKNLKQPPFNTSLMGVLKGVFDYYDIELSNGWAYGGSGHAFLINIHEVVCPSSPYVWKYDEFFRLLNNLGLETNDLGFFDKESGIDNRRRIEDTIRQHLDAKRPCSLMNMDNQIIKGYDDTGLLLIQPWGSDVAEITPAKLTYGTWEEFGDEVHVNFYSYNKVNKVDDKTIIKESLDYVIDLYSNPQKYSYEKYTIGTEAYNTWIKALEKGEADSHGNWWNAAVWSECRDMAAEYFREIAKKYKEEVSKRAEELSNQYNEISDLLEKVSDKERKDAEKISLLREAKTEEEKAIKKIESFIAFLTE